MIGVPTRLRRAALGACLLLAGGSAAIAGLHGCGLESTVALNPPDYVNTDSLNAYFVVRIDGDNDEPELRGVEFYYRFYPDAGVNSGLATHSELVANGFRRLASTTDTVNLPDRPLVLIDPPGLKGLPSEIKVDFGALSDLPATEPEISAASTEGGLTFTGLQFRRGVSRPDLTFKSFVDYLPDDDDIDDELGLGSGTHTVYLALYALSFGKIDLTIDTYSRAVFLLSVQIPITID